MKPNINKSNWNDSVHIFFSPKLSLEGRKMFPQLVVDSTLYHREPNFLKVFKKPLVNLYDKGGSLGAKKQQKMKYVQVIGENKNAEKRIQTTNNKKRCISPAVEEQLLKNYQETLTQAVNLHRSNPKKRMSQNKIAQHTYERPEKKEDQELFYFVGTGNNSELIQQILGRRFRWGQTNSSLFHFRWQQIRPKYHNNPITRQIYNHLPNHEIISDKVRLVNCLKAYCEKSEEEMYKIIPVCFQFNFSNLERCQNEIKKFVEFYWEICERSSFKLSEEESTSDEKNMKYASQSPKKSGKKEVLKQSKNFRSYKKQGMSNSPEAIRKKQEIKQFHKILLSKLKAYHVFLDMATLKKESPYITPSYSDIYGKTSLWLLKPSDLNRGRGIHLFRTIEQLGDLLKTELSKHQKGSFIIQKYIEKPFLIASRKFDIRVYGLVTQNQQFYFFKQGYIRTSSQQFDINSTNYYTHLTNNAIQKYSKTYGQFQEGNILPLHYLFENCGVNREELFEEMKRKIKITFLASRSKLFHFPEKNMSSPVIHQGASSSSPNHHSSSKNRVKHFEIFGYDFMLDESKHLWLIQVNTNPCIELSNTWLKSIIPRMLDDAFKLTIDRMFPKGRQIKKQKSILRQQRITQTQENVMKNINLLNPTETIHSEEDLQLIKQTKKPKNVAFKEYYSVPGYPDAENMWEQLVLYEKNESICTHRGLAVSQEL